MNKHVLAFLVALTLAAAACSDGDDGGPPRSVDVGSLTFEEVQRRALEAARRPGQVLHVAALTERRGNETDSAAWLHLNRDVARVELGGAVSAIYYERRVALAGERFSDAAVDSTLGNTSALALEYFTALFSDEYVERSIDEAAVEGAPAIRLTIEERLYERSGTQTNTVYLDEAFLPLKLERAFSDGDLGGSTTVYTYEFVAADTLADEFFSPEQARAASGGVEKDLRAARDAGFEPYWLGASFEDVVLRDESRWDVLEVDGAGSERAMRLSYGPADSMLPSPCLLMTQYTEAGWNLIVTQRQQGNPRWHDLLVPAEKVALDGATATIYAANGPAPPRAPDVPGAPVLPDVPDDGGVAHVARVFIEGGGIIEVLASCGPSGTNVYRTGEGFRRAVSAIRPYDAP